MPERRASLAVSGPKIALLIGLSTVALVWLLALGEPERRRLMEALGPDVGVRVVRVVAGLGALAFAAWGLLPGFYHAERALRLFRLWWRARGGLAKAALSPAAGLAALFQPLAKILFLAAAGGVVLLFLLCLMLIVWVFKPDLFGGYEALRALVTPPGPGPA